MSDPFGLRSPDAGEPADAAVGGSAAWRAHEHARGQLALTQAAIEPAWLRWLALFGAAGLWLRAWRIARGLPRGAVQRYDLTDDGIVVDTPTSAVTLAWADVRRIVETSHHLLVFTAAERGRCAIPWRVFGHLERSEVRAALRRLAQGATLELTDGLPPDRGAGPGTRRTQARRLG